MKSIRFKNELCPWLGHRDDIFNAMHERDYHHNKAPHCTEDHNDHWNQYKILRNKVNIMMRDAKREYYTNENLKWNDQINNICRKMCNSLGIMRRINPFVPQSSLVTIYNTMFLPHLDYDIILWSNCGNTNLSRIQKLQNTAMRIILSAAFRTHINDNKNPRFYGCQKPYFLCYRLHDV